jgi:hypothetical protein
MEPTAMQCEQNSAHAELAQWSTRSPPHASVSPIPSSAGGNLDTCLEPGPRAGFLDPNKPALLSLPLFPYDDLSSFNTHAQGPDPTPFSEKGRMEKASRSGRRGSLPRTGRSGHHEACAEPPHERNSIQPMMSCEYGAVVRKNCQVLILSRSDPSPSIHIGKQRCLPAAQRRPTVTTICCFRGVAL